MSTKKQKESGKKQPPKGVVESPFHRAEKWFGSKRVKLLLFFCFCTALFSLLLFNLRISEGGDDSAYVYAGYKYAHNFFHYFYQSAPLYPIFLSLPIKMFGVNIFLLKFISVALYFFSFLFFFKALEKRVPYLVLIPALCFYTFNSYLQFFASQTYNEAFFLFFQSLFLFAFFRLLDRIRDNENNFTLKEHWKYWIAAGLLMTAISLIKNLGVIVFPITILFFLLQKQWKNAGAIAITSLGTRIIYGVLVNLIWGSQSQFKMQSTTFLWKDPYIADKGSEDISGLFSRFFGNCQLYLSDRTPQILGFRNEYAENGSWIIAFGFIALFIGGLIYIRKEKEKALLYVWLYVGGMIFSSFVVLQLIWNQERLIVTHIPLLLLVIAFCLYRFFSKYSFGYGIYIFLATVLITSVLISSFKKVAKNYPVISHNLKGDKLYGFTPDWQHFLSMSKWCADSLPENAVVVSRKSGMSFIYSGGKEFFPINQVIYWDSITHQSNPDSALMFFKKNKIQYLMMASLRLHKTKDGATVNTIEGVLAPVTRKYRTNVRFIHAEGEENDEPCYLYEVRY